MRLLIVVISLCLSFSALACQCPEGIKEMNLEKYNRYDLIITGIADSVSDCNHSQTIFVNIQNTYKGGISGRVKLSGNDCNSSCGLHIEEGKTYVIYAIRNGDNSYTIPHCSGSHPILTNAEIAIEQEKLMNNPNGEQTFTRELEIWTREQEILQKLLKPDGYAFVTYQNGRITAHGHMEKGVPHGKWTYLFPDGKLEATGHYLNGRKEGAWTEYTYFVHEYTDATQHIHTELVHTYGTYVNGLKEGKWHKINADGSIHTFYYKAGKYVNQID